ncbi:glutamate--cysteine ligase [Kitasatospora sp. NPDC088346]|uniref:carboxylate-amine ligase n=1 Tax=Kitasatospora sp. NPDC088346 TaxID=3364073 RepID=UPI00382250B6
MSTSSRDNHDRHPAAEEEPGRGRPAATGIEPLTLGVEEEYLLLDPQTGLPLPRVEEVRAAADLHPALESAEVQPELLQSQVEIATPVCRDLSEVGGHLLRLRHSLAAAAESSGCHLAACGTAPYADTTPPAITDAPRYRSIHQDFSRLADENLINGMHVHVGIPDRQTGVAVLNRLRPWLPLLVGLAANSPLWYGTDTGFSSWRTVVFNRWPISGVPPRFADADDYDRRITELQDAGMIRDRGQLYWQARLSERYPTLEVRAMDVQLRADEAVMLAGLVRALATTVMLEERDGHPAPSRPPESLAGAGWHAARYGLTEALHDPFTGRLRRVGDVVSDLVEYLTPALALAGDEREVTSLLHRLLQEGNGADRQRRALEKHGRRGLVDMIAEESAAS